MAQNKRSSGRRGGPPGCLFWLLLLVVVLVLFLINLGKIKETLERTNFTQIVSSQRNPEADKPRPVQPAPSVEPQAPEADKPGPAKPDAPTPKGGATTAVKPEPATPDPAKSGDPRSVSAKPDPGKSSSTPTVSTPGADAPAKKRQLLLYFIRIDEDGVMVRQEVKRQAPLSDQPLTDALAALLGGPTEAELRKSLVSLIPEGTKLLSAQVRGSTVFLNFNEAFMYNHYGIEGYAGQLKQVVFTATAFPTVHDVQILIEGERHDYLGGEGVYIGKPLSRNSF